jgi:type I restriction enzyme S subunit
MPRLRTPDALVALFPLPPLAELQRFVAKVDELMALCDKLEAMRKERENRREKLVQATLFKVSNAEESITNTRFFLDNIPHITTRPEHIKQLRQTILYLAVRGKLVPQYPTDEPASELLKHIQKEKSLLLERGIIKKQKSKPILSEDEIPFNTPKGWIWVRLDDITDVQDPNPSHRMPNYILNGGVPFISSENFIGTNNIDFSIGKRVSQETLKEQIERFPILEGALAFSRIGTIGKSRFLPTERTYCLSHALCVINPLDRSALNMRLLRVMLEAKVILAFAHRGTRSIGVPDLGMGVIRSMAIPLPPLAEQHRIVAKVDELMSLCDKLETRLDNLQTDNQRLLQAILQRALS